MYLFRFAMGSPARLGPVSALVLLGLAAVVMLPPLRLRAQDQAPVLKPSGAAAGKTAAIPSAICLRDSVRD